MLQPNNHCVCLVFSTLLYLPPSLAKELPTPVLQEKPMVMVEHLDALDSDQNLKLSKVVALTLEKYPDAQWLKSLEEEAEAIGLRSRSNLAGAASANLSYQEATSGTLHYLDAAVQLPLWHFGQKSAEQRFAKYAALSAGEQSEALRLKVAGLVRNAVWDIALANLLHEQAQLEVDMNEQLLQKVEKRVALGDLPQADTLLARSELLQKRSKLTQAEAEVMHARKRYMTLTQLTKIPADYQENLSNVKTVQENHVLLTAINSLIERKNAELQKFRMVGSGQNTLSLGINSDDMTNDPRSNMTQSFNIGVNVPFGGSAHLAPQLAAINVELNRLAADRLQLIRDLDQAHHEAEHNLEVNRAELGIAEELKQVALEHYNMMQLSFSVGEIDLIDLLKIQSRTQEAVYYAKQKALIIQRDIAQYNQAVGVLP